MDTVPEHKVEVPILRALTKRQVSHSMQTFPLPFMNSTFSTQLPAHQLVFYGPPAQSYIELTNGVRGMW